MRGPRYPVDREVDVVRIGGQVLGDRVEAVHQTADDLLGLQREQVVDRYLGHLQPSRAAQHETAQPVLLLDREAGGEQSTE